MIKRGNSINFRYKKTPFTLKSKWGLVYITYNYSPLIFSLN